MDTPRHANEPLRLGVFHAGALGDCILAIHLLRRICLARQRPVDLTVIARSPVARFAAGRSVVNTAGDLERHGWHTLFSDSAVVPDAILNTLHRFEAIVSFCGGTDTPFACRLATLAQVPFAAIDPVARPDTLARHCHITEQWAAELAGTAIPLLPLAAVDANPLFLVADCDRQAGEVRWSNLVAGPGRRLLLHPGSGGRAKCWSLQNFEQVARLARDAGWSVAWLLGPVELDLYDNDLPERLRTIAPVVAHDDIEAAARLIAMADAFVGNDAGTTHLAAALGVKTIAIFGPTDPAVWRPLGPDVRTIRGETRPEDPFGGLSASQVLDVLADTPPAAP